MCVEGKLIHGVANLTTLKMCEFLSARGGIKLTGDQVRAFHPSLLHQVPDGLELRHNLILLFPSHRLHTEDKKKSTAIYWQGTTLLTAYPQYVPQNIFASIDILSKNRRGLF